MQKSLTKVQVVVATYNGILTYGMDVDEHPMDSSLYCDYWFELYDPVTTELTELLDEKLRAICWEEQDPIGKNAQILRKALGDHIYYIKDIHLLQMIAGRPLTQD